MLWKLLLATSSLMCLQIERRATPGPNSVSCRQAPVMRFSVNCSQCTCMCSIQYIGLRCQALHYIHVASFSDKSSWGMLVRHAASSRKHKFAAIAGCL